MGETPARLPHGIRRHLVKRAALVIVATYMKKKKILQNQQFNILILRKRHIVSRNWNDQTLGAGGNIGIRIGARIVIVIVHTENGRSIVDTHVKCSVCQSVVASGSRNSTVCIIIILEVRIA